MKFHTSLKTPMGELLLVANKSKLIGLHFENGEDVRDLDWTHDPNHPVLAQAAKELREYFDGTRTRFSVPVEFGGTEFQNRVWEQIARIPFGKTISYSELAQRAGAPKAVRAAGTSTGANPLAIIIPCHRVMGKDGSLTGFGGGLPWKRHLLNLENIAYKE